MTKITFNNKQSPFFKTLKAKVDGYFSDNQIHPAGNQRLLLKSLFQFTTAVTCYVVLVFFTPPVWISIPLCFLLGVDLAAMGFNIMHEGGHQSFSRHKWLNSVSAYALNMLGGTTYFWKIKHNINHHTYTNIESMDADLDVKPFMRLHEEQPRYWMHQFQHIYWVFLYGISYIAWVFYNDFKRYFGVIAPGVESRKLELKEHLIFWFTKAYYVAAYLALPIYMVGWSWGIIGFLIVTVICGLTISIVFQLAHVVECTQFPEPDAISNKISQEWAIHQVNTTANFATDNKAVSWLLGGLNFQVEHHLFPRVSHVHYSKLNQFVRETCAEFGVEYLEYPSVWLALQSHIQQIKKLGAQDEVSVAQTEKNYLPTDPFGMTWPKKQKA